tara:strand:+ start:575 stop:1318 length:744 start_codon:yes stop_codon:yes gene_type:complete
MSWWGKNKPVLLNCYTHRPEVFNYFPIVESRRKIPEWFKKLPSPYYNSPDDTQQNLKLCPAALGLFSQGFILPLWSDLFLEIGKKGTDFYKWQYSDNKSHLRTHHSREWGNHFALDKYQHLKLSSPWFFECFEKISFLAVEPEWQFDVLDNLRVLNGVLEFYTQGQTNVNMFFKRQSETEQKIIPCGTPLYKFIPLTEREVIIKTHLISKKEFDNKNSKMSSISFIRHFEKKRKLLKNKCPYKTTSA